MSGYPVFGPKYLEGPIEHLIHYGRPAHPDLADGRPIGLSLVISLGIAGFVIVLEGLINEVVVPPRVLFQVTQPDIELEIIQRVLLGDVTQAFTELKAAGFLSTLEGHEKDKLERVRV